MNISSLIVIPAPQRADAVADALRGLAGVEVALVSPEGKIIVTVEAEGDQDTVKRFEEISVMDGVMSVSMVYHHKETDPEAQIPVEA